jgi:hypothetical protein
MPLAHVSRKGKDFGVSSVHPGAPAEISTRRLFRPWVCESIGRGAGSCLVRFGIGDTSQRPVQRFLPATSVSLGGWVYGNGGVPFHRKAPCTPSDLRCRSHGCRSAPSSIAPGKPGETPRTSPAPNPIPLCAPQARPPNLSGEMAGPVRHPRQIPRIAGGRPFSADPCDEGARPSRITSADPARLPRLAAYPSAGWHDSRHGFAGRGKCRVKAGTVGDVPCDVDPRIEPEDDERSGGRPRKRR